MPNSRESFTRSATAWALSLVPVALVFPGTAKNVLYAVLLALAIYLLWTRSDVRHTYRALMPTMLAFALYLPYSLASIWLQGGMAKSADNGAHFAYFLLIAICFREMKPARLFWYGISVAAFGAGVLALYQRFGLGLERPYGMYGVNEIGLSGAIKFGMVTALFSLLALVASLDRRNALRARLCHGGAALAGFAGCQAIASRGPWLALMTIGLGIAVFRLLQLDGKRRWTALLFVFVCTGLLIGVFYPELHLRLTMTMEEISKLRSGNLDTSIGARIAMWEAALAMFNAHPLFGVGINQFGVALKQMIAAGEAPQFIAIYGHTHNEYLESMATGGLVGLAYLLWLFGAPLVFFLRRLSRHRIEGMDFTPPLGGLITVLCFALFAIGDNIFDRQMTTSLYAFLVLGFAVMSMDRQPV